MRESIYYLGMAEFPASQTQSRVADLFGLTNDGTRDHVEAVLEAAGLPADGCPAGMTWRDVKKLSDDELRAALPTPTNLTADVVSPAVQHRADRIQRAQDYRARHKEYGRRQRQNDLLRANGFGWIQMPASGNNPSPLADDWDEQWTLVKDGQEWTVEAALASIGR